MLKKLLIKSALKMLVGIIESDTDYGKCSDYGVLSVNSDFDTHVITLKKSVSVESDNVIVEQKLKVV